jgi:hypothetical protein
VVTKHAALAPQPADAPRAARDVVGVSCTVLVRQLGGGLISGADLENYVGRAVWDAVEGDLGDPDLLRVAATRDRLLVRAEFGHPAVAHAAVAASIVGPVTAALERVGCSTSVVLTHTAGRAGRASYGVGS